MEREENEEQKYQKMTDPVEHFGYSTPLAESEATSGPPTPEQILELCREFHTLVPTDVPRAFLSRSLDELRDIDDRAIQILGQVLTMIGDVREGFSVALSKVFDIQELNILSQQRALQVSANLGIRFGDWIATVAAKADDRPIPPMPEITAKKYGIIGILATKSVIEYVERRVREVAS